MKKIFIALLLCSKAAFGQQHTEISQGGCGTVTSPAQLQEVYDFVQHNPAAYAKGTAVVDSIPVSIHIVGKTDGTGYYTFENLSKVMCQLNQKYAPVNFYFYLRWPIQYINNDDYYVQDYFSGEDMMDNNNVAGTVNIYFVQDPAGNCGYYTYSGDAVSIGKSCAGNNSTTVAHELGHYFTLPHTFSGWENGNTPSNPEAIRRTGTGANCNSAGDGFCDTDADYLSVRWSCPFFSQKTDVYGDLYHLDSSMYMSYSSDACQSRFSNQQIAKMQNNLHTSFRRAAIYNATPPARGVLSAPAIISPTDTIFANTNKITWSKVAGADYYYVRISLITGLPKQTILTADTSLVPGFSMVNNAQYTVTVSPVNAFDICMNYSSTRPYIYSTKNAPLSIPQTAGMQAGMSIYPNPLTNGDVSVQLTGLPAADYTLSVVNISGQVVHKEQVAVNTGNQVHTISLPELVNGVYYIHCNSALFRSTQKLTILK